MLVKARFTLIISLALAAGSLSRLAGRDSDPAAPTILENGDVNGDGVRDLSDAVSLLSWLFNGGSPPKPIAPPGLGETETILPFAMESGTIPNPAAAAAAAAGAPGPLAPELEYLFYCPRDARAVAYFFHGGDGGAQTWIHREEDAALVSDLVRNKLAVVLVESSHRPFVHNWFFPDPDRTEPAVVPPWLDATVNADEMVVRDVHARLGFTARTPIFLVGFSSGSRFASAMAYSLRLPPPADIGDSYITSPRTPGPGGLDVIAAALYCNVGIPYYFGNSPSGFALAGPYTTPTIFNYAENDPKNDPAEVEANADFVASLGVPVERNRSQAEPLLADRLARVLGVSYAESRWVHAELAADPAFMDAAGFLTAGAETAPVLDRFDAERRDGILQELDVVRARHAVMSKFHDNTVAFFAAQLSP